MLVTQDKCYACIGLCFTLSSASSEPKLSCCYLQRPSSSHEVHYEPGNTPLTHSCQTSALCRAMSSELSLQLHRLSTAGLSELEWKEENGQGLSYSRLLLKMPRRYWLGFAKPVTLWNHVPGTCLPAAKLTPVALLGFGLRLLHYAGLAGCAGCVTSEAPPSG